MKYEPQVNDYVIWKEVQGWIYFKCPKYITIEVYVRPKSPENYRASPIHANNRVLMLCYQNEWKDLNYVKSRSSIYDE